MTTKITMKNIMNVNIRRRKKKKVHAGTITEQKCLLKCGDETKKKIVCFFTHAILFINARTLIN